jgi:hypothetical protein
VRRESLIAVNDTLSRSALAAFGACREAGHKLHPPRGDDVDPFPRPPQPGALRVRHSHRHLPRLGRALARRGKGWVRRTLDPQGAEFQVSSVQAPPHPPTRTSAASPAARARRHGRCCGRKTTGAHPPTRTSAASPAARARRHGRCRGRKTTGAHPPTRTSAASPAARARRYGRCRGRSVERVFTARPELAQFRQGTYHGTNVPALCTDINRKLASAKEHQADALDGRAHLSH